MDAISQDEQVAEAMLNRPRPQSGPTVAEYTPTVERLDAIIDRLGELAMVLVASRGGRPGKVDRMPRPRTAFDRVKRRHSRAKHRALVARMLPDQQDE